MSKELPYHEYLATLPDAEKEVRSSLLHLSEAMRGNGFDSYRPLSAEMTNRISRILYGMAWGDTFKDAEERSR
jgi:hypothetical protein